MQLPCEESILYFTNERLACITVCLVILFPNHAISFLRAETAISSFLLLSGDPHMCVPQRPAGDGWTDGIWRRSEFSERDQEEEQRG